MKTVTGDLVQQGLQGEYDVIVQGCNCMCQMGKGLALVIKNTWPEVYETDCQTTKGDKSKLGTCNSTTVDVNGKPLTIVNGYTQYNYGTKGQQYCSYEAIEQVLTLVKQQYSGKKIGMPKIGCNLAGGDWAVVSEIVQRVLGDEDVTVVSL
jgi:O-acetyl-ADP-ribose deacetylase (regulator of RNase III)